MSPSLRLLALAAALATVLAAGCSKTPENTGAAAPSTTVGTEIDDGVVTSRVKAALMADPDIKSFDLKTETRKGEVQLSGFVDNQAQMDRATAVVRAVQGVTAVDNKTLIKVADTTVGAKLDDSILTTRVKSALLADASIKSLDIGVVSRNGEVQLSGFVNNRGQIDRAVEVARTTEGAKSVSNDMTVKK